MLNCVFCFMIGNFNGCNWCVLVDGWWEGEGFVGGIVVIREKFVGWYDLDIMDVGMI